MSSERTYRPVAFSRTSLSELMIPSYANFGAVNFRAPVEIGNLATLWASVKACRSRAGASAAT